MDPDPNALKEEDVEDAGVETLEENDENKTNKVGLIWL